MSKIRKELILEAALNLFAERGYVATPTSMIAKEAGVSQGLIFRYYINKVNLLEEVLKAGYRRIIDKSRGAVSEDDPIKLIENVLDMPMKLVEDERNFWRMQFRLIDDVVSQKHHRRYTQSVRVKLADAFEKLGYNDPEMESEILMLMVEALWRVFLADRNKEHFRKMVDLIKSKYTARNF